MIASLNCHPQLYLTTIHFTVQSHVAHTYIYGRNFCIAVSDQKKKNREAARFIDMPCGTSVRKQLSPQAMSTDCRGRVERGLFV